MASQPNVTADGGHRTPAGRKTRVLAAGTTSAHQKTTLEGAQDLGRTSTGGRPMRTKLNYIAPLFAAGAAALAIAAAPIAAADPAPATTQSCNGTGSGTECQSPGNVQLDDSPGPVSFD